MKERILRGRQDGQSLIEVAFALPMLLMLVVGIVELGFALNAYNQAINASREGARFGSLGGSDTGISSIVQGAASHLIEYNESNSDLFVVRAELTGSAPNCSVITGTFSCTPVLDSDDFNPGCLSPDEIVSRLEPQGTMDCDMKVVAVDLYYRSSSLLRLPLVKQLSEAVLMRSLTVMRMESPRPLSGMCNAYPIAIHRSLLAGKNKGDKINDILNGTEEGNFGWLRWPNDPSGGSAVALEDALTRPTTDEFENADDPDDTHLSVGDWIWANTGLSNSIGARNALDSLMNKGWIRVVVFDEHAYEGGIGGKYHASNFAIVKLTDYNLPAQNKISIEFIGMDSTGCIE
ncbi:MAG: TadE family protein [Anaerolineae bacterium]